MVENLWAVGAPPATPLRELTALPHTPGGEGNLKNPTPLSGSASIIGPSVYPPMKTHGHALNVTKQYNLVLANGR